MKNGDWREEMMRLSYAMLALLGAGILLWVINEDPFFDVMRVMASFFWLFLLPGYVFLLAWELPFLARLALGGFLGAAVTGMGTYYGTLIGIPINVNGAIWPTLMLVCGVLLARRRKPRDTETQRSGEGTA